jgi:Uma2 family endonuclease
MQFHDQHRDVLLNPRVLIEVVSPSTEAFDRGEKFRRYRTWLPSLSDYILVAQSAPVIDHYHCRDNNLWELHPVEDLEASLHLAAINCTLRLSEVYDRVAFPAEPAEDQDDDECEE